MANEDPRLVTWCRSILLVAAGIHWLAVGIVVRQITESERAVTQYYTLCKSVGAAISSVFAA
jgi:hypothetical protein